MVFNKFALQFFLWYKNHDITGVTMSFENYFDMAMKTFRSMTTGLFLYPLFVALSESFDLKTHHFLPQAEIVKYGIIFIVVSLLFFPLSHAAPAFFAKKYRGTEKQGKKIMTGYIISVAMSETIAVFGLVIYIISADIRYFYLFFILSFVHLILHRPKKPEWQRFFDR